MSERLLTDSVVGSTDSRSASLNVQLCCTMATSAVTVYGASIGRPNRTIGHSAAAAKGMRTFKRRMDNSFRKDSVMPDWCECELIIKGQSGVLACLDAIAGTPYGDGRRQAIDFERIVPMPRIVKDTVSGSSADAGRVLLGDDVLGEEMLSYLWVKEMGISDLAALRKHLLTTCPEADELWGTKWNACYCQDVEGATDSAACIHFSTAWSPPTPVVQELSRQFPKLKFTLWYWEGGEGFRGVFRARGGDVWQDVTREYRGSRGG
mgnify:CR=1 FL=1